MTQTHTLSAYGDTQALTIRRHIDFGIVLVVLVVFGFIEYHFRYQAVLGEPDLYRVLVGVLDGAESGQWLNSPLHYDRDFGFGYLAMLYQFVDPGLLINPDAMVPIMNNIGLWALLPGLLLFWTAVRLINGALAATIAVTVFAFSPMMIEVGTSGHQVLPMFAFLSAAAVCMFLPLRGWQAALAGFAAMLLLVCGFLSRGEIFLAFPWLVLARIDTRNFHRFIASGLLRSIPPIGAIVAFLFLQRSFVTVQMGATVGEYFFEFYTWATVPPGVVYMVVGCGLATAALGGLAVLWLVITWLRTGTRTDLAALLGPVALIVVPMAFFLPNPMPTRHFMLTLAGFGIVLGIIASIRPSVNRAVVYAAVLTLVVANHALAELVRPVILRVNDTHSPYLPSHDAYPTTTHANVGWFWQRHAALIARRDRWQKLGDALSTSCDAKTLALSDEGPHFFTRLYVPGLPIEAGLFRLGEFRGAHAMRDGKEFIVLEKMNGWPQDAVATVLADPALNQYQLVQDPFTLSRYDRTPIPADRAAKFGCNPGSVPQSGKSLGTR